MESPFDQYNNTIIMYLEPILNTYSKTYQQVITFSEIPSGPIHEMVATISSSKLSPFQTGPFFGHRCIHVLCRYRGIHNSGSSTKLADGFMGADDIPSVFSYLRANGYTIDTDMTKMMNKSRVTLGQSQSSFSFSGERKMICIFTI